MRSVCVRRFGGYVCGNCVNCFSGRYAEGAFRIRMVRAVRTKSAYGNAEYGTDQHHCVHRHASGVLLFVCNSPQSVSCRGACCACCGRCGLCCLYGRQLCVSDARAEQAVRNSGPGRTHVVGGCSARPAFEGCKSHSRNLPGFFFERACGNSLVRPYDSGAGIR
ncbi:MAG: hypothetical protein BWY39_00008 [Spirochaetes bacterium ADurb.Bin269]|nr:MAG: hypothetical protein BWY39_00008 [Spirochaetes bacterium ADurb.Bin269]